MIATVIRHYIYDLGISLCFDKVTSNFAIPKIGQYLNKYWIAHTKDGGMVAFGLCIQDEGELIVLENEEGESIIRANLFMISPLSEQDSDLLNDKIVNGELEFIEYTEEDDEQLKKWLETKD